MATIRDFRDLEVWQLARHLNQLVFEAIIADKSIEDAPLKDQVNRSAGSVMDNIAEGFGRGGTKEFRQYLAISKGSLCELESQLIRCQDRRYLEVAELDAYFECISKIKGKLISFSNYLNKTEIRGFKYKSEEPFSPYASTKENTE